MRIRVICARVCALIAVVCLAAHVASADNRFGIETRPTNTTCVAPPLTQTVKVDKAFGVTTFNKPISLQQAPLDSSRWFVAERPGLVKTFDTDTTGPIVVANALDLRGIIKGLVDTADSQQAGITSISLHPDFDFPTKPYLYVAYNAKPAGSPNVFSYLARFTANGVASFNPTPQILLAVEQNAPWHHIGRTVFGPDHMLYVGLGEGSRVFPDPHALRAQDPRSLFGKILRIDVDHNALGKNYGIPADNPYANGQGGAPEVYAMGFRNPWFFSFDSFDRENPKAPMWEGDVGEKVYEEVNRIVKGGNYGWPYFEGPQCNPKRVPNCANPPGGLQPPYYSFTHADGGAAVIGGFVYRGSAIPHLQGTYIFGAAGQTALYGLPSGSKSRINIGNYPSGSGPNAFYEANDRELYIVNSSADAPVPVYKLNPGTGTGGGAGVAANLSETGCFRRLANNTLQFAEGVIPYDINMPLWSDGAGKLRGMALPLGKTVRVNADGDFDLPPGTVLIKTFVIENKLMETRLFMRHPNGVWQGYSYEWNAAQTDAHLLTAGLNKKFQPAVGPERTWVFPSRTQCLECHTSAAGNSLGLETAQINRDFTFPGGLTSNQIETWKHIELFLDPDPARGPLPDAAQLPAFPSMSPWHSAVRRARAYLHANCSMCHRQGGTAQAFIDLRFAKTTADMKVCNATTTTTDLGVPGAKVLVPQDPSKSLIALRMSRRGPHGMPPLASKLVDSSALKLIRGWISRSDVCDTDLTDIDGDGVLNTVDNCIQLANPDQGDSDQDGYGNRCDGDFNADLATNGQDRVPLEQKAARSLKRNDSGFVARFDLNRDLIINGQDVTIFNGLEGKAPGRSGLHP